MSILWRDESKIGGMLYCLWLFLTGYDSMPCMIIKGWRCAEVFCFGLKLDWIVAHGMGIRIFVNCVWITDPPDLVSLFS
jgi:hypothetical protein